MKKYKAFGMILESEHPLTQVPEMYSDEKADIQIRYAKLSEEGSDYSQIFRDETEFRMCPPDVAYYRVTNGNLIEVEPISSDKYALIGVYIMGTCMGAIIYQRGFLPMHGSCVTDGVHGIMISGDSGAGKSTLAAEFLRHGWKLVTDDVALLKGIEDGHTVVQSSYPSQKLWEDSLKEYERKNTDVHTLYERDNHAQKFGVDVSETYYEGCVPLSLFVRLVAGAEETMVVAVTGFGKVQQFQYNTYRNYLVTDQQKYFQRCVTLGSTIPMALAYRKIGDSCAEYLYQEIVHILDNYENRK